MRQYQIFWKPSAVSELKKLKPVLLSRVINAIEALASNPFPSGVCKLQGGEHSFRIRVGDYRVIYSILDRQMIVEIIRVRHRKDVYR